VLARIANAESAGKSFSLDSLYTVAVDDLHSLNPQAAAFEAFNEAGLAGVRPDLVSPVARRFGVLGESAKYSDRNVLSTYGGPAVGTIGDAYNLAFNRSACGAGPSLSARKRFSSGSRTHRPLRSKSTRAAGAKLRAEWGADFDRRVDAIGAHLADLAQRHPVIGTILDSMPYTLSDPAIMHWMWQVLAHRNRAIR